MRRWVGTGALAALLFAGGWAYARFWWGPGPEALARQRLEVERLSGELQRRLGERARLRDSAGESVLVGVPAGVAERVAGEVVTALASEIRLTLRDLRFRKADEVRARLLLGRRAVGRFVLSVHVREVRGVLRPGPPRLRFAGEQVGVTLPVAAEGTAEARVRFKWDGRGMAGTVCGDVDVTHEMRAAVGSRTRSLEGSLRVGLEGAALVAQPEFGDVEVGLDVEPSADTWRFVERLVAGRSALCRAALARVDLPRKLRGVLARGVRVRLPRRVLERPLRLPLALDTSLALPGRALRVETQPLELILTEDRLWYSLRVGLRPEP